MDDPIGIELWIIEIESLKKRGLVICPLMINKDNVGRFSPNPCACDVPKTRSTFLAE